MMIWIEIVVVFIIISHMFLVRLFAFVRQKNGTEKKNLFIEWLLLIVPFAIIVAIFLIIFGIFVKDETNKKEQ